ncbi:MAG: hypothetical protein IKH16_08125 [Selenomonadaceae bacterium]|nr:hypothetical protein [Selenomonadaceae bacterium]
MSYRLVIPNAVRDFSGKPLRMIFSGAANFFVRGDSSGAFGPDAVKDNERGQKDG